MNAHSNITVVRQRIPPVHRKTYEVQPHEGRFLVVRNLNSDGSQCAIIDDCRTKPFADARAEFLNSSGEMK